MRFKPKMGFVKIYRDMLNQEPFKHRPDIFLFYVYLVSKISFGNDTIEIKCEELAKVFGKNRATIANWLKELKSVQLIDIKTNNRFTSITLIPVELIDDDQNATSHQIDISVTSKPLEPALILSSGPSKNIEDKNKEELHNALLSEQKSLDEELSKKDSIPYKEILDHLNTLSGKSFRLSEGNKRWIKARWNEGYKLEDFKKVNEKKVKAWKGGDMEKYLRPETLYGNKFDGYLNEDNDDISFKIELPEYVPKEEFSLDEPWLTEE